MDLQFKKASELSLEQLLQLWNASFEDYMVNMNMDLAAFVRRAAFEELDLDGSIVMYADGEPAGITLNGYRLYGPERRVWNGGTGIVKAWRGKGLGKPLIEASLEAYRSRGVNTAYLEVFTENEPAVRLYASCGYEKIEELRVMSGPEDLKHGVFGEAGVGLEFRIGVPAAAGALDFYDTSGPWQTHWQCLKEGLSVIVSQDQRPVGYALYRNIYDGSGKHASVVLVNVGISPEAERPKAVLQSLLRFVMKPGVHLKRHVNHVRSTETVLGGLLEEAGFTSSLNLLHMKRNITDL